MGIPENVPINGNLDLAIFRIVDANRVTSHQCEYFDTPLRIAPAAEVNGPQYVVDAMRDANNSLNDHVRCRLRGSKFGPSAARGLHFASRAWLGAEIAKIRTNDPDAKIVIVTHHAPILDANSPQYRGGALAPAFVSDLSCEIDSWRPNLWVFGHTHHDVDQTIGETRLLSHQRGYVGREAGSLEFRPALVEL